MRIRDKAGRGPAEQKVEREPEFHLTAGQKKIFVGLLLGMLVGSISQTIVGPAMPTIVAELGGMEHYSWIATGAMLASAIVVPIVGKLSDMYGRRGFYLAGLIIFMTGSVMSGFANNFWFLVAARAVQGLGMGTLQPLSQTIIGDLIPARNRGKYQGIMGAVFGVTSVLGPLVGGWITDSLGWRWLFFLPVPLGIIALYFIARFLHMPEGRVNQAKFDMWGALTLIPALVLILLATTWGGNMYDWNSSTIIGMFVVGAVFLGGFIWAELRAADPLLPLRMFAQNIFTMSVLATFTLSVAMFGAIMYIPVYAQVVLGSSATNSGVILMPLSIAMIITSIVVGLMITRTGRYKSFMVSGLAILVAGYVMLSLLNADSSKLALSGILVVIGFSLGLSMQVFTLVVQNSARTNEMGIATSAVQFFRNLGSTVGTAILGTAMSSGLQENITSHLSADMQKQIAASGQTIDAGSTLSSDAVEGLPAPIAQAVRLGMADSMHTVFLTAIPFVLIGLLFTVLIKNKPLRTTVGAPVEAPEDGADGASSASVNSSAAADPALVSVNSSQSTDNDKTERRQ